SDRFHNLMPFDWGNANSRPSGVAAISLVSTGRHKGTKKGKPGAGNRARNSGGSGSSVEGLQPPALLNSQILGCPTIPVEISRPSGKKARAFTVEGWPRSRADSFFVARSMIKIVPSRNP